MSKQREMEREFVNMSWREIGEWAARKCDEEIQKDRQRREPGFKAHYPAECCWACYARELVSLKDQKERGLL